MKEQNKREKGETSGQAQERENDNGSVSRARSEGMMIGRREQAKRAKWEDLAETEVPRTQYAGHGGTKLT